MQSTYESWSDSFQFSEDLKALEHVFQAEQKQLLKVQQDITPEPEQAPVAEASEPKDEPAMSTAADSADLTMDMLSVKIAQRLIQFLGEPEVMAHYMKLHELHSDNSVMAQQVAELMEQVKTQAAEITGLRRELKRFHRCVGTVYLRR